jgi:hypothetical protein
VGTSLLKSFIGSYLVGMTSNGWADNSENDVIDEFMVFVRLDAEIDLLLLLEAERCFNFFFMQSSRNS